MTLIKQIQLIARIQADLRKEAVILHNKGNVMARTDCDEQAESLDNVLDSLRALRKLRETASSLLTALRLDT